MLMFVGEEKSLKNCVCLGGGGCIGVESREGMYGNNPKIYILTVKYIVYYHHCYYGLNS